MWGKPLHILNQAILWIFVAEVVVKMGAEGRRPWRYFLDPWNIFDFVVVTVGCVGFWWVCGVCWVCVV